MRFLRHSARSAIAPILLVGIVANAAPDDRFLGGAHDGNSTSQFLGYTPPTGGDDPRFVGGGGFDGYAASGYSGYRAPSEGELGRFVGGSFDGYGAATFRGYTPPAGGQLGRFVGGGGFDGYASTRATAQPNPLSGDSDGDDVPDWWEAKHYLSLTLADALTDVDGDGAGSHFEWIADTDPNDPESRLSLLAIRLGAETELDFGTTSPARRYWIEASTSGSDGSWSSVSAMAEPGNGSNMTLTTSRSDDPATIFRVRVALPE